MVFRSNAAAAADVAMCIALPARVLALEGGQAVVDLDGRVRRASLLRAPEIAVGDWALIAAGTVIRRLEAEEAGEIDALLRAVRPQSMSTPRPGGPR